MRSLMHLLPFLFVAALLAMAPFGCGPADDDDCAGCGDDDDLIDDDDDLLGDDDDLIGDDDDSAP